MVAGPHSMTEAAAICGCSLSELCPGPMAAIDEGDKVRAIYDGSWRGANASRITQSKKLQRPQSWIAYKPSMGF